MVIVTLLIGSRGISVRGVLSSSDAIDHERVWKDQPENGFRVELRVALKR